MSTLDKSTEHKAENNVGGANGETTNRNIEMTNINATGETSFKKIDSTESDEDDPVELEKRRHFPQDESRQYPKEKLAYLVLLWLGLTVITFLKGGKGVDSVIGVTCKDPGYYILLAAQFLWTLGFAAFFGVRNMKKSQAKRAVNYPFLETDV